ncbi:Development/cell death domain [Dillenia turbinata]|uniref:Development/cell death domain n=1 Tax=Dillenia turbinata TaxID=194707 RepID=A0AAN8Z9C0_9MAGN
MAVVVDKFNLAPMGAGRKRLTLNLKEKFSLVWTVNGSVSARNLKKEDLAGVIFGCKHSTINECYFKQLQVYQLHMSYVRKINPGLPLFLFNYSDRKLHGIFEAASTGQLSIDPHGWTHDNAEETPYPARVRIQIRAQCFPLSEEQFRPIIADNYYEERLFWFELDRIQTKRLISLFSASPVLANTSITQNMEKWSTLFSATRFQHNECFDNPAASANSIHPHHKNIEWESSWDSPTSIGESEVLEAPVQETKKKNEQEVGHVKPNNGYSYPSYASILEAPVKETGEKNEKANEKANSGCTYASVLMAPVKEAEKKWEQPNNGCSYASLLRLQNWTSISSPRGNFCIMSGDSCPSSPYTSKEDKNIKIIESNVFFPHANELNKKCESSHVTPCLQANGQLLEATNLTDSTGTNEEELVLVEHNDDSIYPLVVSEGGVLVSGDMAEGGYLTEPSSAFAILGQKNGVETALEEYAEQSYELNLEYGSSFNACSIDGESQCSEASTDKDAIEIYEEGLVRTILNKESSLMVQQMKQEDVGNDENLCLTSTTASQPVYEPSSEAAGVLDKSSDLYAAVAELIHEVHKLKASQKKDIQKINSLEQALRIEHYYVSNSETQHLKDRRRTMESWPCREQAKPISSSEQYAEHEKSLLLVGGFDGSSWLSALDAYSPSLDLVKRLSSMSFLRSYASSVKLNGEIYIFGGVNGSSWYDAVESYNLESSRWMIQPSLNKRKGNLAGASINTNIYTLGGGNGSDCFSEVELLDPNVGRSLERFDHRETSWTRLESMSTRRGCHSLVTMNEKLYALGGHDGFGMLSSVEVFDPQIDSWRTLKPMRDPRGYSGAAVHEGKVYMIGGLNDTEKALNTVEIFDGNGWTMSNLKAVGRRCFLSAIPL